MNIDLCNHEFACSNNVRIKVDYNVRIKVDYNV